jgi:DNA-binding transcriptional regulator YiaG
MAHQINMTADQFNAIRKSLGLSVYALRHVIGVSQSHCYKYATGKQRIPEPVARLMLMLERHGTGILPRSRRGR